MDQRLISWATAVKSRCRINRGGRAIPPVWLFTDEKRLPDPRPVVANLPKGLCGVVFRHDGDPKRLEIGRDLARLCKLRRNVMVVAGDGKLAHRLRAGMHLRGGRGNDLALAVAGVPTTSSAHSRADAVRARRGGAGVIFISPLFETRSHPGATPLGVLRALLLSSNVNATRLTLGGIHAPNVRRIPVPQMVGFGGIGCFLDVDPGRLVMNISQINFIDFVADQTHHPATRSLPPSSG